MPMVIGGREVKNPFLKGLIAVLAVVFAIGLVALVLFIVLPVVGIVVTSALLIVGAVLIFLLIALPIFLLVALVGGVTLSGWGLGIRGSGVEATESRDVPPFHGVETSGAMKLSIVCGGPQSVTITGDDNLLKYVGVEVYDGVLHIRATARIHPRVGLAANISAPSVDALSMSGATRAVLTGVEAERFLVEGSGATHIGMSGRSKEATFHLSGAGKLDAGELVCETVNADLSGASKATVHASSRLSVRISGAGKVRCYGKPQEVERHISGAGRVEVL